MFFRHNSHKLVIPLAVIIFLLVVSYQPKYHLRANMPEGFFPQEAHTSKPSLDEKIAWAYWENAQMDIQWKYSHGHPLPQDPPADFQISAKALGPTASDQATRMLYWHRLQQVWSLPETWDKVYEFDWKWMSDPFAGIGEWFKDRTSTYARP